ncbi:MAG TPA: cytochrome c [Salinimicrobium sp.]|nr:cytochrome c [Salinimicrobium sp.]
MKSLFKKSLMILLVLSLGSCAEDSSPNYQYMPDMYVEVSYDPYGSYDIFAHNQEAKLPVEGTIPRGWKPYPYENSNEGYLAAKAELENPLPYTEENLSEGKELYTIYCAICHGDTGDGKGPLVQNGKFLGVPAYNGPGRDITEGSIYHVMYYGRNAMGSYASQTSIKERWQIDYYVLSLLATLEGQPAREFEEPMPNGNGEGNMQGDDGSATQNLIPAINADKQVISAETSTTGPGEHENETKE